MTLAVAAAAGFLAIAAFQAVLALGAPRPCGLGGIHARLPVKLRIASAFAVGVWVLAALIILGRAGSQVSPLPPAFARWGRIDVVHAPADPAQHLRRRGAVAGQVTVTITVGY